MVSITGDVGHGSEDSAQGGGKSGSSARIWNWAAKGAVIGLERRRFSCIGRWLRAFGLLQCRQDCMRPPEFTPGPKILRKASSPTRKRSYLTIKY